MKFTLLGLVTALCVSATAVAQTETPSDGVPLPDPSITTRDDATAIESNPAGLGYMRTVELGYAFRLPVEDLDGVVPEGHALFLGVGSSFLSGGLGVQFVKRPSLGGDFQSYRKYTLSLAKSFHFMSLGASLNWFGSSDSPDLDDLVSTEFGLQLRFSEYLGMGFVMKDVNTPFLTDERSLPLRVEWGLALRLYGGRLIIDPSLVSIPRDELLKVVPRLVIEPIDGLRLFANAGFSFDFRPEDTDSSFDRFSVGMSLTLGALGGDYALQFEKTNLDDSPRVGAFGAYTWLSPFKQRRLYTPKKWIHVDLSTAHFEAPESGFFASDGASFLSIIEKIQAATEDPDVVGLVFALGDARTSWSNAWELVQAIERTRAAGKQTLAIMPQSGVQQYYIASAAETVWATPNDTFHLGGLSSSTVTLREALNRIGIEAQFVRIGDYKSAPEPFLVDQPSKESVEQRESYIDAIWESVISQIANARNKTKADVTALLDSGGLLPDEAVKGGWVDALVYGDEADRAFARISGGWPLLRRYPLPETREVRWERDPAIAVLPIEGNIVSGDSGSVPFFGDRLVGDQTIISAIHALQHSPRVRAVVVRINSPGGSATASDRIYRALRKLSQFKPVIASMGGTAASGGYYIAAGADEIWATPTSVTGSIGIFTGKFNASQLLTKIGVREHRSNRGNPVTFSPYKGWDPEELKTIKKSISYLYQLFLHQISTTRGMSTADIDKVARGRVWVGKDAKTKNLVDHVGGLRDAVSRAEALTGLAPGSADVALIGTRTASVDIGDILGGTDTSEEFIVLREILRPLGSILSIPLTYRDGEALMLGDGLDDGSD